MNCSLRVQGKVRSEKTQRSHPRRLREDGAPATSKENLTAKVKRPPESKTRLRIPTSAR